MPHTLYEETIPEGVEVTLPRNSVPDWEGDTVESARKNAYIATFVDQKTKLLLAKLMPDKTKKFAAHKSLSQSLEIDIYFARLYHSWERGLNEHTNGR